jgi:lipocalin
LTEAKHEVCRLEMLLRNRWLQLETQYKAEISKKLSVIDQSIDSGNTALSYLNALLREYGISQSEPHNIQVKYSFE